MSILVAGQGRYHLSFSVDVGRGARGRSARDPSSALPTFIINTASSMYGNIFIMISYFAYYTVLYLELEKKKIEKTHLASDEADQFFERWCDGQNPF